MRLIRDLDALPASAKGSVAALGNFDGMHLGHQAIVDAALNEGKKLGAPVLALSFAPHPREFFTRSKTLRLMTLHDKLGVWQRRGLDYALLLRFNAALARLNAEAFVREVLVEKLAIAHVVTGENFRFGRERGGDVGDLARLGARYGFGATALASVADEAGAVISSSSIRAHLAAGDVAAAARQLGRPYSIFGHVVHGAAMGRALGAPTANLRLRHLALPAYGVYAVHVPGHGVGVANIGVRPTFGASEPLLEVHLFDYGRGLYGTCITVELHHYLRPEQRFEGASQLAAQIQRDIMQARTFWQERL